MAQPDLTPLLHAAIAAEIRRVRAGLEKLAEMFVADVHFATNYLEELQAFDQLIQHSDESAAVLDRLSGGAQPHDAVAAVRLEAVQDRLLAALGPALNQAA
ncbi:MAG: hypothetical protein AVDCRST_MAG91-1370 [uncultured Sphingomonadaceae bacterium]|uniref:Uncharacterized protein n=1 Tax=uncultured Sphingomonadaceae bacterium TaxID=169976 RepID=A0A6J4SV86_9SPHN|nr:MAG: hypothetical protein AVDCRST_MAG91-1370 [uncultured Sphingomonadaceae bacterium]